MLTVCGKPGVYFYDGLEAESRYHAILAAAAVSAVPVHAAVLMSGTVVQIAHQSYTHEPQPEEQKKGRQLEHTI